MAYAPNGRILSPGEELEEIAEPVHPQEWQEDLNILLICPDCKENPPNLVEEFSSGDTVCGSCGRVLGERIIDTRSEWRTFSNDDQGNDDPSRVGEAANPLLNGSQLQTEISFGDGGMRSRELARAQNKSTHDKGTKSLLQAYKQISTLCESSNIPTNVSDTAKHVFKMTDDSKAFKGKSTDALIAACIFISCRQHDVPRSFREIYKLTNVSKKEIGRTFKQLEDFLNKKSRQKGQAARVAGNGAVLSTDYKKTQSTDAEELVERACSRLFITRANTFIARAAARRISELGVAAGRSPLSICGASVYLITHLMGQPKTPKEIGAAVDVSDGTIRTAYKLVYNARDAIIDEEWIRKGGDRSRIPVA